MTILLLIIYAGLLLWATFSQEKQTKEDFFLNKRASSAIEVGLSIVVSSVGASATIGMIGMVFVVGTPAFWWFGAACFGLLLLSLTLAKKVRESNAYTLPHLVETLLGKEARFLIAFIIVMAWIAILAAQFSAIISIFSSLLNINTYEALALGFAFIVLHSLGGQRVIMRLDRIQAIIIGIAFVILLFWINTKNPLWFQNVNIEIINPKFPLEKLFYFLMIVGANYLVCPTLFSRILSAKNEKVAKKGVLIGVFGLFVSACLLLAIGLASRGLVPENTSQDMVLATLLSDIMPAWLVLVISFALLSAIISSADTCLVVASTIFAFDILHKTSPKTTRITTIFIGLAGALLTLWGKGILGFLLMAYDVFACGVVMPIFIAFMMQTSQQIENQKIDPQEIEFVKVNRQKINGQKIKAQEIKPHIACLAIILGGVFGIVGAVLANTNYTYIGLFLSGIITYYGFLHTKP